MTQQPGGQKQGTEGHVHAHEHPDHEDYSKNAVGHTQAQIAALDKLIEANANDAVAYNRRGVLFGQLAEPHHAVQDFDEATRIDPKNPLYYFHRGMSYIQMRQPLMAVEDFTRAIRLDPKHIDALNNRAAAYYDINEAEKAVMDANATLKLSPDRASAFAIRAMGNAQLGKDEEARADALEATSRGFHKPTMDGLVAQAKRRRKA